jgi:hypothetical protein
MDQEFLNQILQYLKNIADGINNPTTAWISLFGVLVALFLGVLGIFQDWIRSLFRKPKLNVSIKLESPDCHKITMRNSQTGQFVCDSYYFRFRIENTGNYQMEDVEAMVVELYKKINGQYEKVKSFLPLNLVWAHSSGRQITKPKIQPKLFKYLDFGYIVQTHFANLGLFGLDSINNIALILDVEVPPNTGSHIVFPGDYKIKIKFAANNFKPVEKIYNLVIPDSWNDDEQKMLNSISIQEI